MANLRDLSNQLQSLKKQIPFATARALTTVARQIQEAEKAQMKKVLQNPTPFTVNSVGSIAARKDNLVAKVFVRDIAAGYLDPFEFGGVHQMTGVAKLVPINIKLNKYGNIPSGKMRNRFAAMKANPKVFFGKVNGIGGAWQRHGYKKVKTRRTRSKNGTRQDRIKQPPLKFLGKFEGALAVHQHLDYFKTAQALAAQLMPGEMSKALDEAMRTAK